jgi:hypothetical protein
MNKQIDQSIQRSSTTFLQVVLVLIGMITLALLLIMPHFEGRNDSASLTQIYFNDPFLAYVYLGSIPFFVGIYQAFKLLGYIGHGKVFSQPAVNALKTIKYCSIVFAGAIVTAGVYLGLASTTSGEDAAGAIMLGLVATFASVVIGAAAAVFEKTLQSAVDIKSENDLTV